MDAEERENLQQRLAFAERRAAALASERDAARAERDAAAAERVRLEGELSAARTAAGDTKRLQASIR